MKVQEALRSGDYTLQKLSEGLGIRLGYSESDNLVTLNYCQIESPKHNHIVKECRGLVLEIGSWDIVARSFNRFFNYGEAPEVEKKFDWDNFVAESKEDGSLMLLFNYKDCWRINTRGSFANNEIVNGCGVTWKGGFFQAIKNAQEIDSLPATHTYVFEFCSRWNKVVRDYSEPTLFLLSAFHNKTGTEASEILCDRWAEKLGVQRPKRYYAKNAADIVNMVENHPEPTFEGCVVRDRSGTRIKVKNPRYVALHHLKDNGNLYLAKNMIPLIMENEGMEILLHFPEAADKVFDVIEKLNGIKARTFAVWEMASGIESQKNFAIYVNKHCPKTAGMMFTARKSKKSIEEVWRESQDHIIKIFEESSKK